MSKLVMQPSDIKGVFDVLRCNDSIDEQGTKIASFDEKGNINFRKDLSLTSYEVESALNFINKVLPAS